LSPPFFEKVDFLPPLAPPLGDLSEGNVLCEEVLGDRRAY
jgi:hypothetical protein